MPADNRAAKARDAAGAVQVTRGPPASGDDARTAPAASVLRDDENLPFVYTLQHDGSFARQHVTLGDRIGEQYAIPEGLKAGDQIVVDGALFMQFMQTQ